VELSTQSSKIQTSVIQFTPEASEVLIDKYCMLRQDDASGIGKNSYCITVRQLESMIRLSEVIACINCTNKVLICSFVRITYNQSYTFITGRSSPPSFAKRMHSFVNQLSTLSKMISTLMMMKTRSLMVVHPVAAVGARRTLILASRAGSNRKGRVQLSATTVIQTDRLESRLDVGAGWFASARSHII
jgi:MCM AAA-lid domain